MRATILVVVVCCQAVVPAASSSQVYQPQNHRRSGLRTQRRLGIKPTSVKVNSKSTKVVSPKAPKSSKGGKKGRDGTSDVADAIAAQELLPGTKSNSTMEPTPTEKHIDGSDKPSPETDSWSEVKNTTETTTSTSPPDTQTDVVDGESTETATLPTASPTNSITMARTVKLLHPSAPDECLAYDATVSQAAVQMVECTTSMIATPTRTTQMDLWEILDASSISPFFFLRHKESQLCIPQNPEFPNQPFDCFRYSGDSEAIADSLNGLVDCNSGFAATMGMEEATGSLYLYNQDCLTEIEPGHETDVILMSYRRADGENGTQIALWGERVLLDMHHMVEEHRFQGNWTFMDV
ncbi:MAG: hypothetical protein SGILL_005620 [Bacillariaceae sp.]